MSKTQPIVHSVREKIRFATVFAAIVAGLFATLRPAYATPQLASIQESAKKIRSRATDLKQLSEGLMGEQDRQITSYLRDGASHIVQKLRCVETLLMIDSLIGNEADKTRIQPFISLHVEYLATEIEPTLKLINREMAAAHNQAVINTASKLKDDLRELKELLAR